MALAFCAALMVAGCGMPGAPMPPSLNLPDQVGDLSAVRTGGQVALTWTMPTKKHRQDAAEGQHSSDACAAMSRTPRAAALPQLCK